MATTAVSANHLGVQDVKLEALCLSVTSPRRTERVPASTTKDPVDAGDRSLFRVRSLLLSYHTLPHYIVPVAF